MHVGDTRARGSDDWRVRFRPRRQAGWRQPKWHFGRRNFSADLAAAINRLLADPKLRERMARAGRKRVEREFAWPAIAQQTAALYASLVSRE